jgi:predicted branched-subunit amino acid permease
MTIRQYIKRRFAWGVGVALSALVFIALLLASTNGKPPIPVLLVGIFGFVAAVISLNFAIRCPKCRGNLGITIVPAMFSPHWKLRRVSYCPFCGVSIDEEASN